MLALACIFLFFPFPSHYPFLRMPSILPDLCSPHCILSVSLSPTFFCKSLPHFLYNRVNKTSLSLRTCVSRDRQFGERLWWKGTAVVKDLKMEIYTTKAVHTSRYSETVLELGLTRVSFTKKEPPRSIIDEGIKCRVLQEEEGREEWWGRGRETTAMETNGGNGKSFLVLSRTTHAV